MSKKLKKNLSNLSKKFEEVKDKQYYGAFKSIWKQNHDEDPLDIVTDFIKSKGLKLYGGLALHKHLKKKGSPIYKDSEFPDYDVFSPNAWEHAKELCDILFSKGYYFVEARSSILNDEHHQTYKVSVDMIYVLDLTQMGCSVKQINNQDCEKCSVGQPDLCESLFNNVPVYDIKYDPKNNPKVYTKTYDYSTNSGYYPNKMFVCSPDWLKISMYREITEPLANPARLEKVSTRLAKFEKHFKLTKKKCRMIVPNPEYLFDDVLKTINKFIKDNNFIHYGSFAYNFYIKNNKKKIPEIKVFEHEVYADGLDHTMDSPQYVIFEKLKKKYSEFTFKIQEKIYYWKETDSDNYIIYAKKKGSKDKFTKLLVLTQIKECMPYIKNSGFKYATFDRMRHIYMRRSVLPTVYELVEQDIVKHDKESDECLLQNLLEVKTKTKSKSKKKNSKNKFRQFVLQCEGSEYPKIWGNLMSRFRKKIEQTKKTTIKVNYPEKGYITKSYPLPPDDATLPYIPAEQKFKNYEYH